MTKVTKSKSEQMDVMEIRAILEEYCEKANDMLSRGMVVTFSMANGSDGKPVSVVSFQAIKVIKLPGEAAPATPSNDTAPGGQG